MSEEGFEEWDAEFLDQLIQVEELALSSSSSTAIPNPNPNPYSSQSLFPPQPPPSLRNPTSYSPPRQLSQRTSAFDSFPRSFNGAAKCTTSSLSSGPTLRQSELDEEFEIGRLKRELGRVSKQLSDLEKEFSELRKNRDKKDAQANNVSSKSEEKDAVLFHSKITNLDGECGALGVDHPRVSQRFQNVICSSKRDGSQINIVTSSCKATGVQTDDGGVFAQVFSDDLLASRDLSKKLLAIWGLPSDQILGRNLISDLLVACQTDLHVLFGCMGMNFPLKSRMGSPVCGSSNVDLHYHVHSQPTSEAAKVSHLYSVLTKGVERRCKWEGVWINNGMAHLDALLEPLIDLCSLENTVLVHRSLHMFLKHLLSFERKLGRSAICSGIMSWLMDFALGMMF